MKWRKEPPDKPGWWWLKRIGDDAPEVVLLAWADWQKRFYCISTSGSPPLDRVNAESWSGPIEEPQEDE